MHGKTRLIRYITGFAVLVLAACASSALQAAPPAALAAAKTTAEQLKQVRVITVGSPSDAGLLIGVARGYFEQEGMNLKFDRISGGAETVSLLATNQVQVAGAALSAGFFNAVNRGIGVKVVADKGQSRNGWHGTQWVIRKDLWDSGELRGLKDLKGKRMGINAPNTGAITDLMFRDLLQAAGLKEDDIKVVVLPYPDQLQALNNKAVDFVLMIEPGKSIAVERGLAVLWEDSPEKGKNRQVAVLMFSPQFLASEDSKRFGVAYLRGVREFNDAIAKNKNKSEIIQILTAASTVKNPKTFETRTGLYYVDPDGQIDWESVQAGIEVGRRKGWVKEDVDLSRVRDDSVLKHALDKLGKY